MWPRPGYGLRQTGAWVPSGYWVSLQCNMIYSRALAGGEGAPQALAAWDRVCPGSVTGSISTELGKAGVNPNWQVP